jgi:hypothetical protein
VLHAEARRGQGGQPLVGDRLAARIAPPVGAAVESPERPVDVRELGLDLLEDRELLLAFERIAGRVRRVLVDVRQLGRAVFLRLVVEVPVLEGRPQALEASVLVGQVAPGGRFVHVP